MSHLGGCGMLQCFLYVLLVLAGIFKMCYGTDTIEVCSHEVLSLSCSTDKVVLVKSAEYGRRQVGRCVSEADEYTGCTNDIIHLLDKWCSGRSECRLDPEQRMNDLDDANKNCPAFLRMYLKIEYVCLEVHKPQTPCTSRSASSDLLTVQSGTLSSQIAQETGCGSTRSPWKIQVKPGQTVDIKLLDFSGDNNQQNSFLSCKYNYGFILERSLGINHTACGGGDRESLIYSSKTNVIEVTLQSRQNKQFLLQYEAVGCQDPVRPPHTTFKRQGKEVLIKCEKNDQEWHLTCTGTTWSGNIGNCSEPAQPLATVHKESSPLPVPSLIVMACIIGGAVVITVAAIMCGVIHMKKYRMKQERKRMKMQMDYATIGRQSCGNYGITSKEEPLIRLEAQNQNTLIGTTKKEKESIWKMPLPEPVPDPPSHGVDPCACVTLPGHVSNVANNGDNMDFGDAGNYQNSSVKYSSLGK